MEGNSLSAYKEIDHFVWGYMRRESNNKLLIYEVISLIIDYFGNMFIDSKILKIQSQNKLILSISKEFKDKNITNWKGLYCASKNGFSLNKLKENCNSTKNSVVVVETSAGDIFASLQQQPLNVGPYFRVNSKYSLILKSFNYGKQIGKMCNGEIIIMPNPHLTDLNSFTFTQNIKFTVMDFEVFELELTK